MQMLKPVGRGAAARKYDILSALMAYALAADKVVQRQVMRLMVLITARYNWQNDELTMGQAEIARLWSVDERTVKREMAKLKARGWIVTKRQGARGRVSTLGLDLARMMEDTRPAWPQLGADFAARVDPAPMPEASNVVPLRSVPAPAEDGTTWARMQAVLHAEDPATYGAWFHPLTEAGTGQGTLTLAAPTRFHATYVSTHLMPRLIAALARIDPSLGSVEVIA